MNLSWEPVTLDLKTTFRIAHGASDQRHNVIARVEHAGIYGHGEAPAVAYHGETQAGIMAYLESAAPLLGEDPFLIEDALHRLPGGSLAARAALDVALHDLWGKLVGQPLYRLFGLNPQSIPPTSYTVPIGDPEQTAERAQKSGFPIIKIKVGGGQDETAVAAVRKVTDARLRLDANAGWSRQQALELVPRLVQYDLELIEQPLPVGDVEGLAWLRRRLNEQQIHIPIFADENVKSARDVAAYHGAADGVVIKLAKTGGLREAFRAIAVARALDMQVMIGCMVESTLGVTAAAHLAPLCDYVDLDGPLLIRNDPFTGVRYNGAELILPSTPGLGAARKEHPGQTS
jgi:L-alanine-DL-glutamate epimerase-like enolase superfamily enzyme